MYRLLIILTCIALCAPSVSNAEAFAQKAKVSRALIKGRIFSFAGAKDGSVYLLADNNRIVKVNPDGSQKDLYLPKVFESKPGDKFCDLVIENNSIYLCGFAFPVVFKWNMENPHEYEIVRPSDKEFASLNIINVNKVGDELKIQDADGFVFNLENGKLLKKLKGRTALNSDAQDGEIAVPDVAPSERQALKERIVTRNGKRFWIVPSPASPKKIKSIEFLGRDLQERHIFLVMTGSGELDSEFCLYAVKDGQIEASKIISGPEGLEVQHLCRLSPDGTVLHAQASDKKDKGIILTKIKL